MSKEDKKYERPEAYPKPSVSDQQLKDQPEFIDQQPNDFRDKSVSDLPATDAGIQQANDPRKESQDDE